MTNLREGAYCDTRTVQVRAVWKRVTSVNQHSQTENMNKSRQMWDSIAGNWAADYKTGKGSYYKTRAEIAGQLVQKYCPTGKYLDFGCGQGFLVGNMASRGYEAYGCDLSPEMLKIAQKNGEEFGLPSNRFCVNEENDVPFHDRFDAISILGVYPYIQDYDLFTRRIREKLRDGGIVVATCTNRVSFFTYGALLRNLFRFRIKNYKSWLHSNYALIRTGTWSGGGTSWRDIGKASRCYSAQSFDEMFLRNSFRCLDSVDLFNLSLLDRGYAERSPVSKWVARRFAWNHLAVYEKIG